MNTVKNMIYKWGFLEFDILDLVFKDMEEQLRTCYNVHIYLDKTGIYLKVLDDRPLYTQFVHPQCEYPTGLLWPRTKVVQKYYWAWQKVSQCWEKRIPLPPPPIVKLLDNKKFDMIIEAIITDLSEYDEQIAFVPYQCYHVVE